MNIKKWHLSCHKFIINYGGIVTFLLVAGISTVAGKSRKIKLLLSKKDLQVVDFSDQANELFGLNQKRKKKLFISDLVSSRNTITQLKKLTNSSDKKSINLCSIKLSLSNNRNSLFDLKAVPIDDGRKKLIECTLTKAKSTGSKSTQIPKAGSKQKKEKTGHPKTLFEVNPLMTFIVDDKGIINKVNKIGAEELGYTQDELLGKKVTNVFFEEDKNKVANHLQECIKNPGQIFKWEMRKICKDGTVIWVKETACSIESNNGSPDILILCDNISKIKEAEKSVNESVRKIEQVLNASPLGVYVYDLADNGDLILSGFNSAADKILKIDHSKLVNKKIEDAFPNLTKTNLPDRYRDIAKNGNGFAELIVEYEDEKIKGVFDVSAIQIEYGKMAVFFSDVTEKRKIFENLERSELKFKSLFEFANDSIFLMDSEIFIDCNKKTLEMFNCKKEDIIGKPPYVFSPEIQPDGRPSKEKALERIKAVVNGVPQRFEWKHKKLNGELFDAEVSLNRITLGKDVVIQAIVRDITERKRSEEQISMLAHALKSIYEAVCITDMMDNVIFVNNSFCKMYGYSKEEILGKHISIIRSNKNSSGTVNQIKLSTLKGGWTGEIISKRKNSTEFLSSLSTSLIRNDEGSPTAIITISLDITERKESERALRESEERFRLLIDSMIEAALIIDREGYIVFANNSAALLVGLDDPLEGIGKKIFEFLHPDFVKPVLDILTKSEDKSPRQLQDEYLIKTINGEEKWVESLGTRINLADKNLILVTLRDVTERKISEQQLMEAKEKAEEMSKVKSNFLANMSHELRTPLVGILGFAELLLENLKEAQSLEMAERIYTSANRLMGTLNLLLDLSRIEAKKVEVKMLPHKISDIVSSQVQLFDGVAERKNLYLKIDITEDNLIARVDEQILRQIINNLVNNALKYTSHGGVSVILDSIYDSSEHYARIQVKDTGIGIPQESLELIFQEFRQVSEGFNRHFEGTGLGLTITKEFVEMLNGRIGVVSKVGYGSTFTIIFPLLKDFTTSDSQKTESVETSIQQDVEESPVTKPCVLIVENDEASRDITRLFLQKQCELAFAESGEEAIELIKNNRFDIILMDINLGKGISGVEATKEIRKLENYKETPIVALTSFAMRGDREEFIKAGCTHYLSKPFTRGSIVKLITNIASKK